MEYANIVKCFSPVPSTFDKPALSRHISSLTGINSYRDSYDANMRKSFKLVGYQIVFNLPHYIPQFYRHVPPVLAVAFNGV